MLRKEILTWQNNLHVLRDFCRQIEETRGSALSDSVPCVL